MDEIVGPWAGYACLPMMEDDVITWWGKGKSSFLERSLEALEDDTNLNFERVDSKRGAEIRCKRVRKFKDKTQIGNAYWHPDNPIWRLKVKKGKNNRSTLLHEFGHSLGLMHPKNHWNTHDTIMSYGRDRSIHKWFPRDIAALSEIYSDDIDDKLKDVIPQPVNLDELTGLTFVDYI